MPTVSRLQNFHWRHFFAWRDFFGEMVSFLVHRICKRAFASAAAIASNLHLKARRMCALIWVLGSESDRESVYCPLKSCWFPHYFIHSIPTTATRRHFVNFVLSLPLAVICLIGISFSSFACHLNPYIPNFCLQFLSRVFAFRAAVIVFPVGPLFCLSLSLPHCALCLPFPPHSTE